MAEKNFFNVRVFQYFKMSAQATAEYQTTKNVSSRSCTKIMKEFSDYNVQELAGPRLNRQQMHSIRGRVRNCINFGLPVPEWNVIYNDVVNNKYTTDATFEIEGLRHVENNPNVYEYIWTNTIHDRSNLSVENMTEDEFVQLFPKTEDEKKLREEFQSLLKQKNKFK